MTDKVRQLRLERSIHEYEVFTDEDSLHALFSIITGDPAYDDWQTEAMRAASLTHANDPDQAADRYAAMVEAYARRYEHFFEDDDAFDEFQSALVERERDLYVDVHERMIEAVESDEDIEAIQNPGDA